MSIATESSATRSTASVSKLRSAALLLQADLGYARVESIAHGDDPRIVVFDTTNHRYHIAPASAVNTPITNPLDNRTYVVDFGSGRAYGLEGVTFSSLSVGGDDQLKFEIYGQLDQATAATIRLACDGHSILITVDPATGEATVGSVS